MNYRNHKPALQNKTFRSEFDRMRREEPKALEKLKAEQPEEFNKLLDAHLNPKFDATVNPDWSFRDWQKKDPKGLVKMKDQDPERFNKLRADYGKPSENMGTDSVNPDWNFRDWQKKDPKGLAEMLNQNPERFKALKAAYGNYSTLVTTMPGTAGKTVVPELTNSTNTAPIANQKDWFKIVSKGTKAEIIMHGFIGPYNEITSKQFISDFKTLEAKHSDIDIDLNSGGGSILDAFPIYNAINTSKANISITVTGMAASMGSILLQAAKTGNRKAFKNARIMVHKPSGGDYGSAKKLRDTADLLDSLEKTLAETYQEKTGQTEAVVNTWLQEGEDKWFTAKEALAAGLIDEIIDLAPVKEPEASLKPEEMHRFFSNQFQALNQQARADQEAERANWNFRDWQKKDAKGLEAMYDNDQERYQKLRNAYGK